MAPRGFATPRSARSRGPTGGAAMLLLPRIDDPVFARGDRSPRGGTPQQSAPLKSVFHLCSKDGCDMANLQALQQRKLSRAQEDAPALSKSVTSPRRENSGARPLTPISSTRSTHRYNGVEGISLSQAGSWLDSRCFREACEHAGATSKFSGSRSARATARRPGAFSEGERFVLKRCKDSLMRRFGTLHCAVKHLDLNGNNCLALVELLQNSQGIIRPIDAKIMYRLLDTDGDETVSISELQSILEAV
mmetsp:Transcript_58977/g.183110  ORF Transcript_58977/g.183110 Transcript_58977/m.183110 type:complete len:248 (+) Transcript_58977:75-818(+)